MRIKSFLFVVYFAFSIFLLLLTGNINAGIGIADSNGYKLLKYDEMFSLLKNGATIINLEGKKLTTDNLPAKSYTISYKNFLSYVINHKFDNNRTYILTGNNEKELTTAAEIANTFNYNVYILDGNLNKDSMENNYYLDTIPSTFLPINILKTSEYPIYSVKKSLDDAINANFDEGLLLKALEEMNLFLSSDIINQNIYSEINNIVNASKSLEDAIFSLSNYFNKLIIPNDLTHYNTNTLKKEPQLETTETVLEPIMQVLMGPLLNGNFTMPYYVTPIVEGFMIPNFLYPMLNIYPPVMVPLMQDIISGMFGSMIKG